MKQVIFKRGDGYYMTSLKNYNSYVWDARKVKKLNGVNTRSDVFQVIENACMLYDDSQENYIIID